MNLRSWGGKCIEHRHHFQAGEPKILKRMQYCKLLIFRVKAHHAAIRGE
jgi:hypothetical protein